MKASRVVVLLPEMSLTGAPRLTLDALEGIGAGGSVRIASLRGGPLIDSARRLGPTVVLRQVYFGRSLPRRLATNHGVFYEALISGSARIRARSQAAQLRRWKPDLVYVASCAALPLVRMLRLSHAPLVLHVHELGSALATYQRMFPELLSAADRYVAVSEEVADDLVDQVGVPRGAITVIPNYVLPPAQEPPARTEHVDGERLIVGGAGNPSWTKGIDLWLLAAREVVDQLGPDRVRFVWVGWRDNEAGLQFKSMISRLGLDGDVELIPETDRAQEHFARFDIFAMASWEESASLVVLETMAMGIPVVCFAPTGGPAGIVGEAGVVIPEISPRHMADAIVDLVRSPKKRRTMGAAGADRVRDKYTRESSLTALGKVLDDAATAPGSRGG